MWSAIKWLVLYVVVQFLIIFGISFIYISSGSDPNLFGNFISDIRIYLVIVLALIFIPLLSFKYKKLNIKKKNINIYNLVLMVIFLSIGYNVLAYYLDKYILFSNLYNNNSNIIVSLVTTVLIGPVIEELMFRGVIYNNLKNKYSVKNSMLITTILFCISHFTLIQIVYTFVFGLLLVSVYEKYQNIKYPIILHMVSNLTTTLISLFIIKDYLLVNILVLLMSFLCLYLSYKKCNDML